MIGINNKTKSTHTINSIVQNNIYKDNTKTNYYDKTVDVLTKYMEENEKNPTEKLWDEIAIREKCLSSKTLGFVSGIGFNKLCRNLRKKINKSKRQ